MAHAAHSHQDRRARRRVGFVHRHARPSFQPHVQRLLFLDLDQERFVRAAVQPRGRQPVDLHVPCDHGGRRSDRHLLGRLHGARGRPELRPLLHVHGRLHLLNASARPRRELRVPHHRLGAGRPQLVRPDRVLIQASLSRGRGSEGVRHERHPRHRDDPRRVRAVRHLPLAHLRGRFQPADQPQQLRVARARARRLPAPRRRGREVGPDPAAHLAAGRHGGSDPGQRPHPCGDHGHRGRLPRGRMHPIYNVAVYAHGAVAIIGAVTALFAATIAIVQTDIKRVLAYSTMSQIGYMFLAVGIGAYSAGFFHLLSHAFFKALLFMAAGNVIHAMHDEQDMRRFGGLWGQLRPTSITFLIGSLSLAGMIQLVGFFSKEQILGAAFSRGEPLTYAVWVVGFATALLTGFYTGRMWWLAFWGKPSPQRPVEHPHEAPPVMLIPVAILAVLTVVGGFIQTRALGIGPSLVSDFLAPASGYAAVGRQSWEETGSAVAIGLVTMVLAAALFMAAYRMRPWSAALPWAQRLLERKYYVDEAYDAAFLRPLDRPADLAFRDV